MTFATDFGIFCADKGWENWSITEPYAANGGTCGVIGCGLSGTIGFSVWCAGPVGNLGTPKNLCQEHECLANGPVGTLCRAMIGSYRLSWCNKCNGKAGVCSHGERTRCT